MKPNRIALFFAASMLLAIISAGCGNRGSQITDLASQRAAVSGAHAPANIRGQIAAEQAQSAANARAAQNQRAAHPMTGAGR